MIHAPLLILICFTSSSLYAMELSEDDTLSRTLEISQSSSSLDSCDSLSSSGSSPDENEDDAYTYQNNQFKEVFQNPPIHYYTEHITRDANFLYRIHSDRTHEIIYFDGEIINGGDSDLENTIKPLVRFATVNELILIYRKNKRTKIDTKIKKLNIYEHGSNESQMKKIPMFIKKRLRRNVQLPAEDKGKEKKIKRTISL